MLMAWRTQLKVLLLILVRMAVVTSRHPQTAAEVRVPAGTAAAAMAAAVGRVDLASRAQWHVRR